MQGWTARGMALLLSLLLTGCAADRPVTGELRGRVLPEPIERPAFTLSDVHGAPYDFAARTAGKLTFLFFGYTYCPDVCPIHMSTLATALRELPYESRERVEVVFVTVDPERDTPERLQTWLAAFDARFVALRGTLEEANAVAAQVGLPPSAPGPASGGEYTVGHPASIVAFSLDGPARVMYPFGTRLEDWAHDLPLLLALGESALPRERAVGGTAAAPAAGIQVPRAFVTRSRMAGAAALYAIIENATSAPAILISIDAPAGRTELHETVREGSGAGERMRMQQVTEIVVPAGGTARLEPGGYHVMLFEPALEWEAGDTVMVRFRFRDGTARTVHAPVVPHAEVMDRLTRAH